MRKSVAPANHLGHRKEGIWVGFCAVKWLRAGPEGRAKEEYLGHICEKGRKEVVMDPLVEEEEHILSPQRDPLII